MSTTDNSTPGWYLEELSGQWRQGVPVSACLVDQRSDFQHIQVFETVGFGRMLVLDGKVQCTDLDEFTYHEMLAHVPLLTHAQPESVLVVGGGDGGTIRETLRHPSVQNATLVEIDGQVMDVCRRWLPGMAVGLQPDARLKIVTADAAEVIAGVQPQDAILVDSSDPEGPSEVLFRPEFFSSLKTALKPDGILALQAGSPFFFPRQIAAARATLATMFRYVRPYLVAIPTYPGGTWCLIAASDQLDPRAIPVEQLRERALLRKLKTRYYSPEVHHASLALPAFIDEA
jgi:spermidine synthase